MRIKLARKEMSSEDEFRRKRSGRKSKCTPRSFFVHLHFRAEEDEKAKLLAARKERIQRDTRREEPVVETAAQLTETRDAPGGAWKKVKTNSVS